MKKTIFEGIVNEKKFDNIIDYNNYIQELMQSNQVFESSSQFKVVDENSNVLSADDIILGFDPESDYISDIIREDSEEFETAFEELKHFLKPNYDAIVEDIPNYTKIQNDSYKAALNKILNKLNKDRNVNLEGLNAIDNQIVNLDDQYKRQLKELEDNYDILEQAGEIIKEYQAFYGAILDKLDKLNNPNNNKNNNKEQLVQHEEVSDPHTNEEHPHIDMSTHDFSKGYIIPGCTNCASKENVKIHCDECKEFIYELCPGCCPNCVKQDHPCCGGGCEDEENCCGGCEEGCGCNDNCCEEGCGCNDNCCEESKTTYTTPKVDYKKIAKDIIRNTFKNKK